MLQGILQPCAAKPDLLKKEGNMRKLRIFTDGACANNQKRINAGGWGAILVFGEIKKELYGGEANTTNNRMEMTALIEALGALKRKGLQMDVFSDSSYLMDCFRKRWYVNWQKNGWKTASKEPVRNQELWEQLLSLTEGQDIRFFLVKGHVDPKKNETALRKRYEKFLKHNGPDFTYEDFLYATEMNNRADELANLGMEPYK